MVGEPAPSSARLARYASKRGRDPDRTAVSEGLHHANVSTSRRVDAYATSPFLYGDTERLAQAVMSYAHAVVRPRRARMAYLSARAKLSEYEATPKSREAARAKQRYIRANAHISTRASALQVDAINQAREHILEAGNHLEQIFGIKEPRARSSSISIGEGDARNGVHSNGRLDLRPRPAGSKA